MLQTQADVHIVQLPLICPLSLAELPFLTKLVLNLTFSVPADPSPYIIAHTDFFLETLSSGFPCMFPN